jgi:eukaryotic-like serine/threonine-protein kinase
MQVRSDYLVRLAGENIVGYTVEEKIWQGATSTVWRCSCSIGRGKWGQTVAIKVLHPHRNSPLQIKQFAKEAKIQSTIVHENIIRVYGLVRKGNLLVIFMEYVYGNNLRLASQTTEIKTDWLIRFFSKLASAVDYLHSRGIVHNDIKPENIIVGRGNEDLKLTDFGFAESLSRWSKKSQYAGGTERYMAPERSKGVTDLRSDIYSFGMLLDEFLKDRLGNERVYSIIVRATQREPFKRYSSMSEVKDELDRLYIEYTSQ